MKFEFWELLLNASATSKLPYAPIFSMFQNLKFSSHVNRVHAVALRIVYQDQNSAFDELLENDGSFRIQDSNFL